MKEVLTALSLTVIIISCIDNKTGKQAAASIEVKQMTSPASDSCAEPYLFADKYGIVYLSWIEKNGKESFLKFSSLSNDKWSNPVVIAT